MLEDPRFETRARQLVFGVLVTGVLLRLIFLEADPAYELWWGYLTDEGRWTEQARKVVLFGSPSFDTWYSRVHFALAPLFQATSALSFSLFGVGLASARLVSATAGTTLLILAFLLLKRDLSPHGLLVAVVVLALQPDLLFLSRVAIPETPSMLFQFLAFWVLLSRPQTVKKAVAGGLLTALALGFKGTAWPIILVFGVAIWCCHTRGSGARRGHRLLAYLGTLVGIILLALAALLMSGLAGVLDLGNLRSTLSGFFELGSLYGMTSVLFDRHYMGVLTVLLMALWVIAGLFMTFGVPPGGRARDIYVGSGLWILVSLVFVAAMQYYPLYYSFQMFLPIALNLGAGLTLLQKSASGSITDSDRNREGWPSRVGTVWLLLPAVILSTRFLVAVSGAYGLPVTRFSHRFALFLLLYFVFVGAAHRWRKSRLFVGAAVLSPLLVVPLWLLGVRVGAFEPFFWGSPDLRTLVTWATLIAAALGIAVLFLLRNPSAQPTWTWPAGYVLGLCLVWGVQLAPKFTFPSHTIVDTSRTLGVELQDAGTIAAAQAASLFLENDLPFTENYYDGVPPRALVVAFDRFPTAMLDRRSYTLKYEFPVSLGDTGSLEADESSVKVYFRTEEGEREHETPLPRTWDP